MTVTVIVWEREYVKRKEENHCRKSFPTKELGICFLFFWQHHAKNIHYVLRNFCITQTRPKRGKEEFGFFTPLRNLDTYYYGKSFFPLFFLPFSKKWLQNIVKAGGKKNLSGVMCCSAAG